MFSIKICFSEPELVEAVIFWVEPPSRFFYKEPKKKNLEPEPGKNSSAP